MNRQNGPDLEIGFNIQKLEDENVSVLLCGVNNKSTHPSSYCIVTLFIDKNLQLENFPANVDVSYGMNWQKLSSNIELEVYDQQIPVNKYLFEIKPKIPIFGSNIYKFRLHRQHLGLRICSESLSNQKELYIAWRIETPDMLTREGIEKISYAANTDSYSFERV